MVRVPSVKIDFLQQANAARRQNVNTFFENGANFRNSGKSKTIPTHPWASCRVAGDEVDPLNFVVALTRGTGSVRALERLTKLLTQPTNVCDASLVH
jgi:hypothetical protein